MLVVDCRPLFGFGVASVFEGMAGRVVMLTPDQVAGVAIGRGVALVALCSPDALDHVEALTRRGRSVIVYGPDDQWRLPDTVAAGAVGFVPECAEAAEVRSAVEAVRNGARLSFPERNGGDGDAAGFACLTRREREVLAALIDGLRPAEIAERDFVSTTTVRNQVQAILTKLNVHSQLEAVALAHARGWSAAA